MTDTTEDQVRDPAALLKQYKTLLAEKKVADARAAELEKALESANAQIGTLEGRLNDITVIRPLDAALDAVSPLPKYLRQELVDQGVLRFEDGKPVIYDGEQRTNIDLLLTPMALHKFLSERGGFDHLLKASGASGGGFTGGGPMVTQQRPPKPPAPSPLGLR